MRYIARCCEALGEWRSAVHWLERAADEAPGQREAPYALSMLYYRRSDWPLCRYWAARTLGIAKRDNNYMTEPEAWGAEPYDLMAISSWYSRCLPGPRPPPGLRCALLRMMSGCGAILKS